MSNVEIIILMMITSNLSNKCSICVYFDITFNWIF